MYNELDQAALHLWKEIDDAVIKPRTELPPIHSLEFRENGISISQGAPDDTIEVSTDFFMHTAISNPMHILELLSRQPLD